MDSGRQKCPVICGIIHNKDRKEKDEMKITADMSIAAVMKIPGAMEIMKKYNLVCAGCKGAGEDSVAKVAVNNGLDLKTFIEDLSRAVSGQK